MLKYTNKGITFAEIPDEICFTYSISNCDGLCEGCHSAELRGDSGNVLDIDIWYDLSRNTPLGITCVCFLGEGAKDPDYVEQWIAIMQRIRIMYPNLKIAVYSGKTAINEELAKYVDYYKVGPYIAAAGPLNKRTTNQRLYLINHKDNTREDITYKFWVNENEI